MNETPNGPTMAEMIFQIVEIAPVALVLVGIPMAIWLGISFGSRIVRLFSEALVADLEKPKNKFDRFSVPYDQDIDDEKPKRQTCMTIGDDGELVEMDE